MQRARTKKSLKYVNFNWKLGVTCAPLPPELPGAPGETCEQDQGRAYGEAPAALHDHLHDNFCHLGKCSLLQQPVSTN